jgi:catechol 2,3-dioxygenase-like lactoylglutathione lyase family enzyme
MTDWDRKIGAMTLFVPDLGQARKFYADAFGLEPQFADQETAMLRFGDMYVFLREADGVVPSTPAALEQGNKGAGQFAIIVDDVDAVCTDITSSGAKLLTGPADRPWGMRTATLADPAGHIWEIAQEIPDGDS